MTTHDVEKKRLREKAKAVRETLNNPEAGTRAAHQFMSSIELKAIETIGIYYPFQNELNCLPLAELLSEQDIVTALPVINKIAAPLDFLKWSPGDDLVNGAYGIPTPSKAAKDVLPDMLLVPMLAFDKSGARLGYGGGFYDRTLENLRKTKSVIAVGFAYTAQEIEHVITDIHDQPLDWMVTENYVRKIR